MPLRETARFTVCTLHGETLTVIEQTNFLVEEDGEGQKEVPGLKELRTESGRRVIRLSDEVFEILSPPTSARKLP